MVRAHTVRAGDQFIVRVSNPTKRHWWRNFWTPWPVAVVDHDGLVVGTGQALAGTSPEGAECAAAYFREYPVPRRYARVQEPTKLLFVRVRPSRRTRTTP